jgi:sortase A
MRRPVLLLAAILVVAAGCSSSTRSRAALGRPDRPAPAPADPQAPQAPATITTEPPLPEPVGIPDDAYAAEPIVRIGTMEIPALGLVHPIYQGVTLRNIDLGPSHWPGTALPGEQGNTVFAGHRVSHDRPFRQLDALKAGDQVIFTLDDVRSTYRVTNHLIVGPGDTWIADQTKAYTGTLYACHPPGSLAQRYVVQMELVR